MLRLLLLHGFIFFAAFAFGQTDDSLRVKRKVLDRRDVIEGKAPEDVTIVSASRSGKTLSDLPVTAFVITKEEIQRNGYTSLTDVLKSVPGVRISRPGSGLLGEMFLMRGLIGNEYTKILINSVPVQPSAIGGLPLGEQLPIAQAEAIEVIYGPAASVYGADAMAGVINIITRTPENSSTIVEGNMILGDHGYKHANFLMGGKLGKNKNVVEYSVYGNFAERSTWDVKQHSDEVFHVLRDAAFFLDLDRETIRYAQQNQDEFLDFLRHEADVIPFYEGDMIHPLINDLPHESYLIGGTFKFRGFQADLHQMYRADHANLGATPYLYSYADPNSLIGESIQRFRLGYNKEWNKLRLTTNISYLRNRANPRSYQATNYDVGNNGRDYYYSASDDIFGEAILTYRPSQRWELTAGAAHTVSSVLPGTTMSQHPFLRSDYRPFTNTKPEPDPLLGTFGFYPQRFSVTGAFLQGFYDSERWTITGGLRWELPSHYEVPSNLFTRMAVLYKITDRLSVRLMSGGAFKAPSPNTAFGAFAVVVSGADIGSASDSIAYELVPNPNLSPESLNSTELGIRYQPSPKIYLELTAYSVFIDELITTTFVPIDREAYPLALTQNTINQTVPGGLVRSAVNDENSEGNLFGLQFIMRARNLIPAIKLNTDFYATFSSGEEALPEERGQLNAFRLVPQWIIKWNIDFEAFKNVYFRMEHTFSDGWFRRFIPVENAIEAPNARIDGFYNLDFTTRYNLGRYTDVFLKVRNVFDAKYGGIDARGADIDSDYNPQVGRNVHIGITFRR